MSYFKNCGAGDRPMSILPEKRKCIKCGRWYWFNPDVGKIRCPHCHKKDYKRNLDEGIFGRNIEK